MVILSSGPDEAVAAAVAATSRPFPCGLPPREFDADCGWLITCCRGSSLLAPPPKAELPGDAVGGGVLFRESSGRPPRGELGRGAEAVAAVADPGRLCLRLYRPMMRRRRVGEVGGRL